MKTLKVKKQGFEGGYSILLPQTEKRGFFDPPRASNGLMTKPFELGGLQMILSEPPMSNSSGGTHMDHASKPKFRIWQKLVKNAHFFIKYELFIEKKHDFLLQKLNFFRI